MLSRLKSSLGCGGKFIAVTSDQMIKSKRLTPLCENAEEDYEKVERTSQHFPHSRTEVRLNVFGDKPRR